MVQSSLSDFFFLSLRLREKSCLGLEFLVLIQDEGSRDLMFIPKGIPDFDRSPPLLTLTLLCVCVVALCVRFLIFFSAASWSWNSANYILLVSLNQNRSPMATWDLFFSEQTADTVNKRYPRPCVHRSTQTHTHTHKHEHTLKMYRLPRSKM